MRMRKKPNLGPRMERCERVWLREPESFRGAWRGLMPGAREVRVEVGCGKGKFTAELAQSEPDVLIIAMEKVPDALVMAMEKAMQLELKNVYFISDDVTRIDELFAPGEVDRLYINFCDPWPRNKSARRRLTYRDFLEKYKKVMKPGSVIEFKTDNAPLFEFSLKEFAHCGLELRNVTHDLHADGPVGIMTGYEERFYGLGTPICRCEAIVGEKTPEQPAALAPEPADAPEEPA